MDVMDLKEEESRIDMRYFASLEGEDELLPELFRKIEDYFDHLEELGLTAVMQQAYKAYYGGDLTTKNQGLFDSVGLGRRGEQDELTTLKQNDYRKLVTYTKNNVTSNRPAVSTRAINSDFKSQLQTVLGAGVVDYYLREKDLEHLLSVATEKMINFAEGVIHHPWNPNLGDTYEQESEIDPENPDVVVESEELFEGDVEFSVGTPLNLIRDTSVDSLEQCDWFIYRDKKNKYDLIADNPELEDLLLDLDQEEPFSEQSEFDVKLRIVREQSDKVPMYYFYHKRTPAMPDGRIVLFVRDAIIFDGPLPYRKLPITVMRAGEITDTPFSYSQAWELLGSQEALDLLNNTLMSNNASLGVQSLWQQTGNTPTVTIIQGMRIIQSDVKPEPLQLTMSAPETYNFRDAIKMNMSELMGSNQTAQGNPPGVMSGSAMALLVTQALSFSSDIEAAYNFALEKVGTSIIYHIQDFSESPRNIVIMGAGGRPYQKSIYKDDIMQVDRVVVERVNPLSKTTSGKLQIAQDLLQNGMIKTPDQYVSVLTTGQLDAAIWPTQNKTLNIQAENEALQDGRDVEAVVTENHADHIREHSVIIENPSAKDDLELTMRVLKHIQQHLDLWRQADPALLMITGQQPPPPGNGMPIPMPGQTQGAPQAPAQVTSLGETPNPEEMQPSQPNMPNLPPGSPEQAQAQYEQLQGE